MLFLANNVQEFVYRPRERERVREKERKSEDKYQLHNKNTLLDVVLTMIATAKAV